MRRGRARGRPPAFDRDLYKARNIVERCFNRLKQFRAIATRFDKLAARYQAGLHLAALVLWLREPSQDHLSDRPRSSGLPWHADSGAGPSSGYRIRPWSTIGHCWACFGREGSVGTAGLRRA